MVVVVEEVLGHFETGELIARRDPAHDAGHLQVSEVAIGRAPRNLRDAFFDLRDAERALRGRQEFHDGATPSGVALIDPAKEHGNELVEVFD
jgi:hypothetical protein